MDPLISFIIVTWNRRDDVLRCLASIAALDYPAKEVIVVDNASEDDTRDAVRAAYPDTILCCAAANLGTSITRNAAARIAGGPYLWFLDGDAEITDRGLARRLVGLCAGDDCPAAIGGEAVLDEDDRIVGVKRLLLEPNGMTRGDFVTDLAAGELLDVDVLATCNLFVHRSAFEAVGGFDPLFFFFLEDADLTYRMRKAGHRLTVLGRVPVVHGFSGSARVRKVIEPRRNRMFFTLKNMPALNNLVLPLLDLAYLASSKNTGRLVRAARKADLGEQGFVRDVDGAGHRLTVGGLAHALARAFGIAGSLFVGYVVVVPHLPKVLAARWRQADHLAATDMTAFRIERPDTPAP